MRHGVRSALLTALLLCAPAAALAAPTPLLTLWFVPDITVRLNGVTLSPQEVTVDDLTGNFTRVSLGALPPGVRISAFRKLNSGSQLLSFDTTVDLGDLIARAGDVVEFDGAHYTMVFDAAAEGVPDGAIVSSVTLANGASLVLSFDVTVKLGQVTAAPSDLVLFENNAFSKFFDGAAAGVPPGLAIDGAHVVQGNGHLLLSFDGSGLIGNQPVQFDDEDVLEYDPNGGGWLLVYDGSALAADWPLADLTSLYANELPLTPTPTATSGPATATATVGTPVATATATTPIATQTGSPPATATATVPIATTTGSPQATVTPTVGGTCVGDCNGNGQVTIDELVLMVNIALESAPVSQCEAGDANHNGAITVNEIIAAVVNALGTCPV